MRNHEASSKQTGGRAVLFGMLMTAALAFSAGVIGARSHKPVERPAVRTEATSVATGGQTTEPRWINPSDQDGRERKVPGHSECDLQLD
jgi:hypothetical protein